MREIKFRGQTANCEWVYGSLVHSKNIQPAIYFEVGKGSVKTFDFVYVKPETVGQFTGLHGKNGVEIYEDDVVKWEDKRIDSYFAGQICFNESQWQVEGLSVANLNLFRGIGEIIGNIHEEEQQCTSAIVE